MWGDEISLVPGGNDDEILLRFPKVPDEYKKIGRVQSKVYPTTPQSASVSDKRLLQIYSNQSVKMSTPIIGIVRK